jgi:rhomboid family GlyGly-CTERM serine protease
MNDETTMTGHHASIPKKTALETNGNRPEIRFWLALLALVNLSLLLSNTPATNLAFDPSAVTGGEWWRIFSWPFVHVSRYHLLIDGTAFMLLYNGLEERQAVKRVLLVIGATTGSLLLPIAIAPQIQHLGLCGLSGIAHGLAAISALEMLRHKSQKKLGNTLLIGLLLKIVWELWSGTAFLQGFHLGDIGQPIVATHAGGVIGGILGYMSIPPGTTATGRRPLLPNRPGNKP